MGLPKHSLGTYIRDIIGLDTIGLHPLAEPPLRCRRASSEPDMIAS